MKLSKEKLASLSKEQKLALLDAIAEKKRRAKAARAVFVPHEGQRDIIMSTDRVRIVTAANGAGKTACLVNEVLWAVNGYNPHTKLYSKSPCSVYVVLDSPEKISDVFLKEMRKWANIPEEILKKGGKPYYSRIEFENGSTVRFLFHEQQELAFESIEADYVFFDEPCPKPIFVAMMRAGRTKGHQARFLLIGTPLGAPWLRTYHTDWEKGEYPDTKFFKMSTQANAKNLAEGYIENFSRHLTEREKATRLHGEFWSNEGMALSGVFKRQHHVVMRQQLPADWRTWPAVISFDPHTAKPIHACLVLAGPLGQLVYVDEYRQKELPRDVAKWMKANWLREYNVQDIISDNSGQADFTGGSGFKSFVEVLHEEGVRVRATTFDEKGDERFLERLMDTLYIPLDGESKLKILNNCLGLIRDIENVQWKPQKGTETYQNKLEIGNKDFLACLKYALAANLTFEGAKRKVIRPPGIQRQITSQPRKVGAFEERWQAEAAKKSAADDFDDW